MSSSRRSRLVALALPLLSAGCGAGELEDLPASDQLFIVSADGKDLRRITDDVAYHGSLAWSPDGSRLAFLSSTPDVSTIEVVGRDGRRRHVLVRAGSSASVSARWSPDGTKIAFLSVHEDSSRHRIEVANVQRPPRRRVVATYVLNRSLPLGPEWSRSGELVYARPLRGHPLKVVISGADGTDERPATGGRDPEFDPRTSRAGDSILFIRERNDKFRLIVARRSTATPVTPPLIDVIPEWAPDGRSVAFAGVAVRGDRRYHLSIVGANGSPRATFPDEADTVRPSWSPDGTRVAFATYRGLAVAAVGSRTVSLIRRMPDETEIGEIAWAPDGRLIAFTAFHAAPSD